MHRRRSVPWRPVGGQSALLHPWLLATPPGAVWQPDLTPRSSWSAAPPVQAARCVGGGLPVRLRRRRTGSRALPGDRTAGTRGSGGRGGRQQRRQRAAPVGISPFT